MIKTRSFVRSCVRSRLIVCVFFIRQKADETTSITLLTSTKHHDEKRSFNRDSFIPPRIFVKRTTKRIFAEKQKRLSTNENNISHQINANPKKNTWQESASPFQFAKQSLDKNQSNKPFAAPVLIRDVQLKTLLMQIQQITNQVFQVLSIQFRAYRAFILENHRFCCYQRTDQIKQITDLLQLKKRQIRCTRIFKQNSASRMSFMSREMEWEYDLAPDSITDPATKHSKTKANDGSKTTHTKRARSKTWIDIEIKVFSSSRARE